MTDRIKDERVAAAIAECVSPFWRWPDDFPECLRDRYRECARAAIAASEERIADAPWGKK